MEDDLITTKEVGDYRIKVYYCHDSECPITNWGLFGSFFFEYSDTHRLHDECNWKTFFYDNKHDLRDVIDAIVMKHIKQKDIDIFFESESDFQEAIDSFNDEKHQKEGWKFKYRNEKVCAFQKEGEKVWIEFIESEFGKPKEILRSFDFTVTKMAYYKEPKYEEKEDDYFPFSSASIVAYEYKLLYHEKFFEHLHMKRLVIDENIPFPVSTWERSYRYKGYGYNMCRETKKKLLQAIKGVNVEEEDVSLYTTGGWD